MKENLSVSERTRKGMKAAKARGVILGRPKGSGSQESDPVEETPAIKVFSFEEFDTTPRKVYLFNQPRLKLWRENGKFYLKNNTEVFEIDGGSFNTLGNNISSLTPTEAKDFIRNRQAISGIKIIQQVYYYN